LHAIPEMQGWLVVRIRLAAMQRNTYLLSMSANAQTAELVFPRPAPPAPGELSQIAPGVLWLRLALPFLLDHVNIYLIEDGDGWAVIDTGIADLRTRTIWEETVARRLGGRPITKLIVTHFHPDHAGLAGWMSQRFGVAMWMPQVDYFLAQTLRHNQDAPGIAVHRDFYLSHGLAPEVADALLGRGHDYLRMTSGLPASYHRLVDGETLRIGDRDFEILTGAGHAPEQAMLLCREENLFLAADQVLARISPNIGVWGWEPLGDPLGAYLTSLADLRRRVPDDVLVLAAHNLPFYGLHRRILELEAHHATRCSEIEAAVAGGPLAAAEIVPLLFRRPMDAHQTGFAFAETVAHVNLLARRGRLAQLAPERAIIRWVLAEP
jgi:glyoxylase-like metal-dependent hydrolase (beta-lactamase superfamily II)